MPELPENRAAVDLRDKVVISSMGQISSHYVHFTGGQKIAWALDEDLRWARAALGNHARPASLANARIVHAAWWPAVLQFSQETLKGKAVVCFADNPPAFYLTKPEFAAAASRVDLWIGRSREAVSQFQALGLPVAFAPYCVDPNVFRPLGSSQVFRQELGIPDDAFVIGNFHRDSEGADLSKPKLQKGPDIFFEIAARVAKAIPRTLVLLAGPRRHWLLSKLKEQGIPCRFAGDPPLEDHDDYSRNILDRPALNRLYQVLDVCVISSRWEGGPYTVLEALFAGRPVVSSPVGMARDVLPEDCVYRSIDEAVELLVKHAKEGALQSATEAASQKIHSTHTVEKLSEALVHSYKSLPRGGAKPFEAFRSGVHRILDRFRAPVWQGGGLAVALPASVEETDIICYDFARSTESLAECAAMIRATQRK